MSAGAIAAAAIKRRNEEEERRTEYSREHLEGNYEFKILRSLTGAFRKQSVMDKALREEALSGWTLIEKFDSSRLRLYRPRLDRPQSTAGIDPYRTHYGIRTSTFLMLMILGVIVIPLSFVFLTSVRNHESNRHLIINGVDYGVVNSSDQIDPWASPPIVNGVPRHPISTQDAEQVSGGNGGQSP
jgi:hypothetical protein